jgi:alpha-L-rhamnosidase
MKPGISFSRIIILLCMVGLPVMLYGSDIRVTGLQCEYMSNPLGMDVANPRLTWQILSQESNCRQYAYEVRVTELATLPGMKDKVAWSTGKVLSDQSVNVAYRGSQLKPGTRYSWQVRVWDSRQKRSDWSTQAWWETGLSDPSLWKAQWIVAAGKKPDDHRPVYFRKEFSCNRKIISARLYVSSLGIYQVFINGRKVSSDLFTPGWTSYKKRIQYQTYDITPMLQTENALCAMVGDGWFRGNIGGKVKQNYYGDKSGLLAQAEIIYSDGTTQQIVTDSSWQTGNGALISSDIYNGETFDATLDTPGWDLPGFKSASYTNAEVLDNPVNILVSPRGYPVRAISEITPLKIIVTPKGETVYDMGQNMVGWVRLKVKGNKGEKVVLKFAEVLDKAGNFYNDNLRAAKATDEYRLKGGAEETWEPHFTFHGFRYVKLEQFPGKPQPGTITGVVIHSDMPQSGTFSCSDSLINQLQHNIQWGQKGNFLDVPTDCPQRDERLGWTGDAQVFAPTAAFNFNVAPFFTKWMMDMSADQLPDGRIPDVVPDVRSGRGSSTAWADASIIVPWTVYQAYGDTAILKAQYSAMKAWVGYMQQRAGEDHLWTGDSHYGDWLAFASTRSDYPGATTDKDLIATAYYAFSTGTLARVATILGKTDDSRFYTSLAGKIKEAFCHAYLTPAGRLVSNTQTAYALALTFGLLPESLVPNAAGYLADDVNLMKHLTTGFVGTPLLCKALSDNGYADLAFMLLMRKEYPSWLYPVTQGATTIWERWDGQKPDGTFQDVSMNSFNHYAYGAIGEWLYNYVGGIRIDPAAPGYKHFFLQPHTGSLSSATAEIKTLYGTIRSEWKVEGGKINYTCIVPANTSATVIFDKRDPAGILLGDKPLDQNGLVRIIQNKEKVQVEIGSGHYEFSLSAK